MLDKKDLNKHIVCPNCQNKENITRLKKGDYSKSIENFSIYFCKTCSNGFTHPVPKNMGKYYSQIHWEHTGLLSSVRSLVHFLLQKRRKKWLHQYLSKGDILDVGAGEGLFGKILGNNFEVTNIEAPFAKVKNPDVLNVDFLKWKSSKKFDGIFFLESLEHVPSPEDYLQKAESLLNKGGYIFVECPRFDSWESKIFKDKWLNLDIPRHLVHLTRPGLAILASRNNLKIVDQSGMQVLEFSPYCFTVSLMLTLGIKPLNLRQKSITNLTKIIFALILLPLGFITEIIFHLFDQNPVEISVFQKN